MPDCWNTDQYEYFKKVNDWLLCKYGKLGCEMCCEAAKIYRGGSSQFISVEWAQCGVGPSGCNNSTRQTSLRKKIWEHKNSHAHKSAADLQLNRAAKSIHEAAARHTEQVQEVTCRVFRTAYFVAQSDRPYTDHPNLISLQQCNGLDLGRVLHSNVVCSDIIDHIASDMRVNLVEAILSKKCHIAVLIDESTSLGKLSCLIVYVRAAFDRKVGPVTFFLDIVELTATNSDGIKSALLQCLRSHGLTDEFLNEYWIGLGVDGASVMLGGKSGVATQLKAMFPCIVAWHCFNHRLELAVSDAVKSCSEINHFKVLMDTLYALYSQSPKCQRELYECASELAIEVNSIGRVLNVRWVASSFRTVNAVWRSYEALHSHFVLKSGETSLDCKERSKFSGLARKFENAVFVKNLGLMMDALEELSHLSLALQKSDVTLPVATKLVKKQVEVFTARKDCNSEYYSEAVAAVESGRFKGVKLAESSGRLPEIVKAQFYQALSDNMNKRLLSESDRELSKAIECINVQALPDTIAPEYGEADIRYLCLKFGLSFRDLKCEYREYRDSKGTVIGASLRELLACINTIPISTAECERGFSKMNLVCSFMRSRLTVVHMSALMFISLCGPPFHAWQPLKYVKSWLNKNRRPANCLQGPHRQILPSNNAAMNTMWDAL